MFGGEKQIIQRMTPLLQRVLIADPTPQGARLLGELMRDISRAQVWVAPTTERALKQAAICEPQIVFVEFGGDGLDGLEITRQLRRSTLACRKAPVIMATNDATAAAILGARDAGVHEFLRKPFSMKDLLRRLEAVTLRQRDWVEGVGYVGPDRRRFNSGDYSGPLKRGADTEETGADAELQQALKILRAAIAAVDSDPQQASRAMLAQAVVIQKAAAESDDPKMTSAAAELYRRLSAARGGPPPSLSILAPLAAPLLAYIREDARDDDELAAA